jgi:hypothetical protein
MGLISFIKMLVTKGQSTLSNIPEERRSHLHCGRGLESHTSSKVKYLTEIYYFLDGVASQDKERKNFINLSYHTDDFGMDIDWHFFVTSHGKGVWHRTMETKSCKKSMSAKLL